MKALLKKLFLIILIFFSHGVSGQVNLDSDFSASENPLTVQGKTANVPIKWIPDDNSPYSALLLPVTFNEVPETCYMQLDFGSPSTFFYIQPLLSVREKYPNKIDMDNTLTSANLVFTIGNLSVASEKFMLGNFGDEIHWDNNEEPLIIGTIGTDLLEKCPALLDFQKHTVSFFNDTDHQVDDSIHEKSKFTFKSGRILLPARIRSEQLYLLYDSGTSAFELVTNESNWNDFKSGSGKEIIMKTNSWGNELIAHVAESNELIKIGDADLTVSSIAYIEGTSPEQNMMMKSSGMGGLIGNRLFIGRKVFIDCKNELFYIK